ncbi:hypothetical protein D477_010346 [Arthrobacter crystallopoietes BAB-32]|uniref:SipW-cognate class signal peptide n=1 Tax=Arthrobacter crystallopoietes BAB-32 TaxID=1246476 RepID=N1UZ34_9MICC|nr:SipW-dependent-type signal peptide-containing protein [Arthrobacter crystallopoietes]EMY34295.1 hypothetical protein D477_010346 [Arthrobacter crystallopoietes BAB-32]
MARHKGHHADAGTAGIRLRALLSLGTVLGLGAVGTLAAWTDSSDATATFSAGTLELSVAADGAAGSSVAATSLSMENMYPGNSRAAMLTVSNDGSIPLGYTLAGSAAQPSGLEAGLTVTVHGGGTAANTATEGTCSGSLIGSGPLTGALLSDARALAPAAAEELCLRVELPAAAGNELQGTATNAVFTFTGTQRS